MPPKSAIDRKMTRNEQILVEENDRLAPWWAMRLKTRYEWWFSEVELEDLIQACRYGLCLAAQRFTPGRAKFSTWAAWWMTSSVQNEMRHHGLVSLPRHVVDEAIQGAVGPEEWERLAALRRPMRIEQGRFYDSGESSQWAEDSIPSREAGALEVLEERERTELVYRTLDSLPSPRIAQAVKLTMIDGLTLDAAGKILGVTRERVRQMRLLGMRQMREVLEAEGVTA